MLLAYGCQWSHLGWVFTDLLWGVACFVAVNRVVQWDQQGRFGTHLAARWLAAVGLYSYSLYLIHEPVLHSLGHPLVQVLPWWIVRPAVLVAAVWLAKKFYQWFELPAIRWSRGGERKPAPPGAAPTILSAGLPAPQGRGTAAPAPHQPRSGGLP